MKIAFRADASLHIGSGHIMRCLVLAEAFKSKGHEVSFVCRPHTGNLIDYIASRGIEVISLPPILYERKPLHSADYARWLQISVEEDANDFLGCIRAADTVVTDHYAIDVNWHRVVRQHLGCKIIAIDDLMRLHDADIIIDQTLGRTANDYPNAINVLAGSSYALLKPDFSIQRAQAYRRERPSTTIRILVSMGGIDNPNATLAILKSLAATPRYVFTVLLSPRAPHYQAVVDFCRNHTNMQHIDFVGGMAAMMLEHDIAIGAPGTTTWERACLGLPSVVIPLAENQLDICEQLIATKSAIKVLLPEIDRELPAACEQLIRDWGEYYENSLKLCDGRGCERVIAAVENSIES